MWSTENLQPCREEDRSHLGLGGPATRSGLQETMIDREMNEVALVSARYKFQQAAERQSQASRGAVVRPSDRRSESRSRPHRLGKSGSG